MLSSYKYSAYLWLFVTRKNLTNYILQDQLNSAQANRLVTIYFNATCQRMYCISPTRFYLFKNNNHAFNFSSCHIVSFLNIGILLRFCPWLN